MFGKFADFWALTSLTLQALAKLLNTSEIANDIIAVIRNVFAGFLVLTPLTLQALAKLVNTSEIAKNIKAVIRNVLAQYPP